MIEKDIQLKVYGRVQGVFFRQSTKAIADQLNVSGWVKNCSDGTVEVLIQGPIDKLNTIITWLHTGPDRAIVEKIEIILEKDCTKLSEDFNILI